LLSKPSSGYADLVINNKRVGSVSYTDDVPIILLQYFIDVLTANQDDVHLNVSLDAEGYSVGFLDFDGILYSVSTSIDDGLLTHDLMDYEGLRTCRYLANELINDINKYKDDWVMWDQSVSFDNHGNEVNNSFLMNERRHTLELMVTELSSLLV
jgi:hypothetical protein